MTATPTSHAPVRDSPSTFVDAVFMLSPFRFV